MKSFVMTCVFLFSCGLLAAEDMKFVTLLSQPVGSFSRVELLDTSKPAEIFHLNFCNTDASGGTIAVSGSDTYPVQAEKLRVLDGATLGGNIKTFEVDTITVGADSTFDGFTGGTLHVTTTAPARIIVDEDSNEDNHSGSATFIHGKAVTINNADFYTMDINNTAVLSSAASGSTKTSSLGWTQVSPSGTTDYPQAYVLTSHSGIVETDEDDGGSSNDCGNVFCLAGYTLNPDTCKCEKNPTTNPCGNIACRVPKKLNTTTCTCECSNTCPSGQVLNQDTCECQTISVDYSCELCKKNAGSNWQTVCKKACASVVAGGGGMTHH